MKTKILFFLIFALTITSCKKKVTEVNPDFVGEWYSESYFTDGSLDAEYISIDETSYGIYENGSFFNQVSVKGKAKIGKDKLKIGLKGFHISLMPEEILNTNNLWQMKLDGKTFYKIKGSSLANCFSPYFYIRNVGENVLEATINNDSFTLYPDEYITIYREYGKTYQYSDNNNNNFSFFWLGCEETIDVQ
jgi:hypothetical protein